MRIVDLRVCLNRSLEIAVVSKEIVESLLGDDHSRLVVRIHIGQIHDLQESRVRERLDGSRDVNHAQHEPMWDALLNPVSCARQNRMSCRSVG